MLLSNVHRQGPATDRGAGSELSSARPAPAVLGSDAEGQPSPAGGWKSYRLADRAFLLWLGVATAILVLLEFLAYSPIYLYFFAWTLGVGLPLFLYRDAARAAVRTILRRAPFLRFLGLGAGMVLAEETVAALVNSMKEGFTVGLWLHRVPQFWLFNLLVFLPLFAGWYLVAGRLPYSLRETTYLTGAVGVYTEHILALWLTNPLVAAIFTPVEMATYAVIALPAMLSLPRTAAGKRSWPTWARYVALLVVPVVFAAVGAAAAEGLRGLQPGWFPPRSEIP